MTNNTTSNNETMTTILQSLSKVKDLKQEKIDKTSQLYSEISIIEKPINSQIQVAEYEIETINNQYSDFAHYLAIEANKCPQSRCGSYLDPTETNLNEAGIELVWIQDNPYRCCDLYDYFTATWSELLAYESKQKLA
jgi:hypothetical protein